MHPSRLNLAALLLGLMATLLCLSSTAQAAAPVTAPAVRMVVKASGSMPCCPENPSSAAKGCGAACPLLAAEAYSMTHAPKVQTVQFGHDVVVGHGVTHDPEAPPPR